MQVHAVPDAERAFNSSGRRLPWAYEFADSDHTQRRIPEEKGPFGKARKRGTSRTKTPTNKSADEAAKQDNLRVVDDIFSRFKADEDKKRSLSGRVTSGASTALPPTASAPNLLDAGGLASSFSANVPTSSATKEPKEVILYGYGSDAQWAAIDFYEKVSNGIIYEEYDREPFNPKFGYSFSQQRASHYRSLSKSALRKVNEFVGGDHWIKVTFDSAEAAERACHYSPHPIQGYKVFAEPYRGTGPTVGDRAIRAEAGESVSQTASPNTMSSGTIIGPGVSQTSSTVSSATATGSAPASRPARKASEPFFQPSGAFPQDLDVPAESAPVPLALHSMAADANSVQLRPQRATLRLKGANVKPAVFLPQEKAFLPAAPRWQQTLGSWPVIGWVIGSGHGIIGDQVPRKEDGSFDSKSASLYWRVWYTVDSCFGTDFCGVRDAEYDD